MFLRRGWRSELRRIFLCTLVGCMPAAPPGLWANDFNTPAATLDIHPARLSAIDNVLDWIAAPGFQNASAEEAVKQLDELRESILRDRSRARLIAPDAAASAHLVRRLMDLMLALDEWLVNSLPPARIVPADLANAKKRFMATVRNYQETLLLRMASGKFQDDAALTQKQPRELYFRDIPRLAFSKIEAARNYHWTVNPRFFDSDLAALPRSFLVISEGGRYSSSALAHATVEEYQFSHMSLIFRTPKSTVIGGEKYPRETLFSIDAHARSGVAATPVAAKTCSDGNPRIVIFLIRDSSRQTAMDRIVETFFDDVVAAQGTGQSFCYDFTYAQGYTKPVGLLKVSENPRDRQRRSDFAPGANGCYSCTSVVSRNLTQAGIKLFTSSSRLKQSEPARKLLLSLGIDPDQPIETPGDADASNTLLRVAEGRLVDRLEDTHIRHAVASTMFRWMAHLWVQPEDGGMADPPGGRICRAFWSLTPGRDIGHRGELHGLEPGSRLLCRDTPSGKQKPQTRPWSSAQFRRDERSTREKPSRTKQTLATSSGLPVWSAGQTASVDVQPSPGSRAHDYLPALFSSRYGNGCGWRPRARGFPPRARVNFLSLQIRAR